MTDECSVALIQKMYIKRQELSQSIHTNILDEGGPQGPSIPSCHPKGVTICTLSIPLHIVQVQLLPVL